MKKVLFLLLVLSLSKVLSSEIYILRLNEREKHAIREILTALGERSIAGLLWESSRLSELGSRIEHLPPLQFLGYILVEPYLKRCLKIASGSYFHWSAFMGGLNDNMEREYNAGRLLPELPGFARLVGGKATELIMLSHEHNWEGFVLCLL